MTDNVEFVTARLAAMWDEITGVTRAYTNIPTTLNSTDLPASVIFPLAVQSRTITGGAKRNVKEQRRFDMVLFVAVATLGDGTSSQIAIAPWFDTVSRHFIARPGLELDADNPQTQSVFDAQFQLDNGYEIINYPTGKPTPEPFAAIRFPIFVTYNYAVTMKD